MKKKKNKKKKKKKKKKKEEERSRCEPRRNLFSQRVVIPCNALPEKVLCRKSTLQFKIEYDKCGGLNKLSFLPRQASHRV